MMQKLLTPDMIDSLRTVFTVADLTKFAKYNPVPEENETSIRLSEQFVEKTKHEPEPVNVEKPNDRDASQINSSI